MKWSKKIPLSITADRGWETYQAYGTVAESYPTNAPWNPWPVQYPFTYVQPRAGCVWCHGEHTDRCPNLKSVTYRRDGTVERVEFFGEEED